jgi:hypothetical protein
VLELKAETISAKLEAEAASLEQNTDVSDVSSDRHKRIKDAVKAIAKGHRPGDGGSVFWDWFCIAVREDLGVQETDHGYADRTITRIARRVIASAPQDK